MEYPYRDDNFLNLGEAMFGSKDHPCNWDNLDLEYECIECKNQVILNKLVY